MLKTFSEGISTGDHFTSKSAGLTREQIKSHKAASKFWPSEGAAGSELYWVHVKRMENRKTPLAERNKSRKIIERIQGIMRKKGWTFFGHIPQSPKKNKK